jgi:progressive ankylosis protein
MLAPTKHYTIAGRIPHLTYSFPPTCRGGVGIPQLPDDRMKSTTTAKISLIQLWREFLPLSLSDVTMACGDPMMTMTLAHLPDARSNLAGVGIAKSLAIFLESPIIMILHASNALASQRQSRSALWRFVLLAGSILSGLLLLLAIALSLPSVSYQLLGVPLALSGKVQQILVLMFLWPFAIAWRRYFQGLLIHCGHSAELAKASLFRLGSVGLVLAIGFSGAVAGTVIAGLALVIGVLVEAIVVTIAARKLAVLKSIAPSPPTQASPRNLQEIWRFYWPLANSMLVSWGGRAALIAIIARAHDAPLALAAWPAAWGLVLVIANSTRMVQQMIIKYRGQISDSRLIIFALTVGTVCSAFLLLLSTTAIGEQMIQGFIGDDRALIEQIKPILQICTVMPLLVALLNASQGFLVSSGRTGTVSLATGLGTGALLVVVTITVGAGINGAIAAAIAMLVAMVVEVGCLVLKNRLS